MDAAIILITIAMTLLTWWCMGLLALAVLGDVSAWWRPRVPRFFALLERVRSGAGRSVRSVKI